MPQFLQNLQRYANNPLEFVNGVVRVSSMIGNEIEYRRKQARGFIEDVVPEPIVNALDSATDIAQIGYENSLVGMADQGAGLLAEDIGEATNPQIGMAAGFLLGMVVPGPSKGGIRLTRVGRQFPEQAEQASDFLNNAAKYAEKHGSLHGYGRFQDLTGKLYKARPRGKNADGTQRFAMSPEEVQRAYTKKRNALDVQSSKLEKFERANFEASFAKEKQDLIFQQSGLPSYKEHNRRLNSPFWKSARAKNQAAGDIDNLSIVNDLEFKTFKDNVDKILDNTKDSPIDAFYDPMIESIVVENIKTGKRLGLLDQTKDIKQQLNRYAKKAL